MAYKNSGFTKKLNHPWFPPSKIANLKTKTESNLFGVKKEKSRSGSDPFLKQTGSKGSSYKYVYLRGYLRDRRRQLSRPLDTL
jgi:hypothetical protein